MRGVHLNRKLISAEKAGVVANNLPHHNQYMKQYCI